MVYLYKILEYMYGNLLYGNLQKYCTLLLSIHSLFIFSFLFSSFLLFDLLLRLGRSAAKATGSRNLRRSQV